MPNDGQDGEALKRMKSMLDYVEQLIKLDENVARTLSQHRLADGTQFVVHRHELKELPGLHLDISDDDGPLWLRLERLTRSRPPKPDFEIAEWISVSNNPDKPCEIASVIHKRIDREERNCLLSAGSISESEIQPSMRDEKDKTGDPQFFDLSLLIDDRPEVKASVERYCADIWAPWAESERPRRRSIATYQRFFEIAQILTVGNLDQAELVLGIGHAHWRTNVGEVDLPILIRGVEIQILEDRNADIVIRPREIGAQVELRAFQALAPDRYNLAEDAARRALKLIESVEPEGVSPFRPESFEPVLKVCASQLDPEAQYISECKVEGEHKPSAPPPVNCLTISDSFVVFARRRAMNVVITDIERLKETLQDSQEGGDKAVTGAARTLVMGPLDGVPGSFRPLSGNIGSFDAETFENEPDRDHDHSDLFFPKAFNDDQVAIVRRLEDTDGIVVQGPPGTGKTHTIANIISHMLATGKRVLVVSHGETALSVIREQLPEQIRDLAISVTTSDRSGDRQVENAISLMLRIVNDFAMDHSGPRKRISALEAEIVTARSSLTKIDAAIADIAKAHFTHVPGCAETPFDLARRLMAERDLHAWFPDRPTFNLANSGLNPILINEAITAREKLGEDLRYLDRALPVPANLPSRETLEIWRQDLLRAQEIEAGALHANLTRRVMAKLAVPRTQTLLAEIETLLQAWRQVESAAWSSAILKLALDQDVNFVSIRESLDAIVQEMQSLAARALDYAVRNVKLPAEMPPREALHAILGSLATGKNPFGFLSPKLNKHRPVIEQIQINGTRPTGPNDWKHVSGYIALQADLETFSNRWSNILSALQIQASGPMTLASPGPLGVLLSTALRIPQQRGQLVERLSEIFADNSEFTELVSNAEGLASLRAALTARLSQARLSAVRDQVEATRELIPSNDGPLNAYFHTLLDQLGSSQANSVVELWDKVCLKLRSVVSARPLFDIIASATLSLSAAGAPNLAALLKTPIEKNDAPIGHGWRPAWDWWASYGLLKSIGARDELSSLHVRRTQTEKRLRDCFAELVRERAFYALAGSMPGQAKSALKVFSDLVRKLGKGTGRKAALHRRDLRSAMLKCYDAVPCWIMPAWRVSEQLPSKMGSFDLVILDEASQSDAKELPALLRGKKVLIVGDDRQISPTDAFIKQDDIDRLHMNFLHDLPFPSHLLPGSSIYDLARVMFPDKFVMLKEHFRCVEPIIRFSMQFYQEPLIPLRVPTANERLDPPLIDILVKDGERHPTRKINEREAEVIVDEIAKIVADPVLSHVRTPHERARTIGVISLIGSEQARLIQQMLTVRLGELKYVEHRIICGDSASLQGNERDIVFLSMIAAGDRRIGAQTAEQYQRRFNVAMSRARDRMILVRSIEEDRLNPNDLKARVIQHFREPMPAKAALDTKLIELCQSGFEREIFSKLAKRGYVVQPQVGSLGYSIDLVVEGVNGQRLAIECDGDLYHGPDRWADDMRRQRILERVGWVFWRVFGSAYALDPEGVLEDLIQTLDHHGIKPGSGPSDRSAWTEHRTVMREVDLGLRHSINAVSAPPAVAEVINLSEPPLAEEASLTVGDRIVLRFIDKPETRPVFYQITKAPSEPKSGLLNILSPLARQLAEIDVGDEFAFSAGGSEQRILFVAKQSAANASLAAG